MSVEKVIYFLSGLFFLIGVYFFLAPRELDIIYYYNFLDNNKKDETLDTKKINIDLKSLDHCKLSGKGNKSEDCYLKFYKDYTLKNGPIKALQHLSTMMDTDPSITPGCHYITHGIGEGAYIYFGRDLSKSYEFRVENYFKNVGACGNGFYHGISIGLTREVESDDELYKILKDFCKSKDKQVGLGEDQCNHGLGHAITIHYLYDKKKAIAMCKRLAGNDVGESGPFGCITGVMMEYGIYLDYLGLGTKGLEGLNTLCKDYGPGTEENEACVMEGSGVVRYGENYIGAAKTCQELGTIIERKACTKLTVIHAIRLGRSTEVTELCKIPKTLSERIECTAWFAKYLAIAVDINKGTMFQKAQNDVCHTLPLWGYVKCISISRQNVSTFRSNVDYGYALSFEDVKRFFARKNTQTDTKNSNQFFPGMVNN